MSAASPVEFVQPLILAYVVVSVGLLFFVRRLRLLGLRVVKVLWAAFTVIAFSWIVMMSGTTNEEFADRPGGFWEQIADYPAAFADLYSLNVWWVPLLLLLPFWLARYFVDKQIVLRRAFSSAVLLLSVLAAWPLVVLVVTFDWSNYSHFGENYRHAWNVARMGDYFFNSVLISLSAVGLVTLISSMAAYALSRLRFTGRKLLLGLIVAAMAIPGSLLLVPLFLTLKGWAVEGFSFSNSRVGLSLIYAALLLPFTTFLLSTFYRNLPTALARAAVLDGASAWRIFTDVYFPLSAPGLVTTAVFNFLTVWNEYHFALVFLTNPEFKTLPVGLYNLHVSQQFAINWPPMFAGIVILVVPTFLTFILLQERIVAGLTLGAVKG